MTDSGEDRRDGSFDPSTNTSPGSAPSTAGHPSFRRQRAARACETCHARKVRCDAASLGVPCTNCVAFSIECRIPAPKRKKAASAKSKEDDSENRTTGQSASPTNSATSSSAFLPVVTNSTDGTPPVKFSEAQNAQMAAHNETLAQFMKPKFARAPITEAGRVAYLGESSNLSLLVHDQHGASDVVHYPLPETIRGSRARLTELDNEEIDILNRRGAFLLPPRELCDELVEAFFKHIAPVVPVINRSRFMRRYRDPKHPPSLLLLQAILLAGSRVCTNPALMDPNGSTTPAALTFYKRAKALYDANYEDDRVTIVQSLILMGWYWEGPEDVTKNVFYWSRVATIVAQGSGMHRSVEKSQLSKADKRLWKRIWWTLFTRDRMVAVALGRPVHINTDDSDVEMVSEDDFVDDEPGYPAEYPPDPLHVQFFLHHVKLCEIMGLVLSQQYSVASRARRQHVIDLTHSDMALADWMINVPEEMRYRMNDEKKQNFWAALLHSTYYTTLCLLHRAHMPPANLSGASSHEFDGGAAYPSRNIAFQAAANITTIIKNLQAHDELRYCPAFVVYSLFSALIMQVYQIRSSQPSIVAVTRERIKTCMDALSDISKVWLVAKMVHALFESILGNKALEERLQKATGHKRSYKDAMNRRTLDQVMKRKFDEMDLSSMPATGQSPQVPDSEGASSGMSSNFGASSGRTGTAPQGHHHHHHYNQQQQQAGARQGAQDAFMGGTGSKSNSRPSTPFQPNLSGPSTPPDLFLVTRSSPPISQSLWENFQPNQLFPEDSGLMNTTGFSPPQQGSAGLMKSMNTLDAPFSQQSGGFSQPQMGQIPTTSSPGTINASPSASMGMVGNMPMGTQGGNMWGSGFEMDAAAASPEDSWSNSSVTGAPSAPATLNVEDWFQFFGLNGMDFNGMGNNNNNMSSQPV